MARTVILHVGAPKTGTSFVQELLRTHRERLAEQGICYPGERFDAHFLAALDLMQLPWGGLEKEARGAWDRLAEEVREWPDTAIVSHEILATASREHVARALESLAAVDGTEFHVVYSARDLARQIPAEWQENVKHRHEASYHRFLQTIQDPRRPHRVAQWFWGVQEIPDVLSRWGDGLPKEQIHLVTVPPAGSPPDILWTRMAQALRLDPDGFADETLSDDAPTDATTTEPRANASLGAAEATMVRRLNSRLRDIVPGRHYRPLVREVMVHRGLAQQPSATRITVPPEVFDWAERLSRSWIAELALRGYDVIGDLDDLVPVAASSFVDPDTISEDQVADAAIRGLTVMTLEAARLRDREAELDAEIARLHEEVRRAHSTPVYRLKQRLVGKAATSRPLGWILAAYRRLRGRNSRSA